jgi:hypothetical protein
MHVKFALRDKDVSKIDDRRDIFNIGDGVVLPIEESVEYPIIKDNDTTIKKKQLHKFRKMAIPKGFPTEDQKKPGQQVVPLRDPYLRNELDLSGMKASRISSSSKRAFQTIATIPCPINTSWRATKKTMRGAGAKGRISAS